MESPLGTIVYLFIGYVCGVFFAPDIFSANLMNTQWTNIWVYAWLFGWPLMLAYHLIWPLITVAAAPAPTPVIVVAPVPAA